MGEMTWIEVRGRHREPLARQRIDGAALTLGRAWDNDVVLDDPHVAAHHLRLARGDDGRWTAEDLGSRNGVFVDGRRTARATLEPGSELRLGQTVVRLHGAGDAVAPEQPLPQHGAAWPAALACIALLFALELAGLWLNEIGEPKLIRYLTPLLTIAAVVAAWTCAWSVLSRVFDGHAQVGRHLRIVGAGLLAFSLWQQLAEFGAFALSWPALAQGTYVVGWLLFAAICFAHLRVVGRSFVPLKAAAVLALAGLGITMQTLKQSDWRATYGRAEVLQRLEPPWMRVVAPQPEGAFFDGSAALQAKLDAARSEAAEGGDDDTGEFDADE